MIYFESGRRTGGCSERMLEESVRLAGRVSSWSCNKCEILLDRAWFLVREVNRTNVALSNK